MMLNEILMTVTYKLPTTSSPTEEESEVPALEPIQPSEVPALESAPVVKASTAVALAKTPPPTDAPPKSKEEEVKPNSIFVGYYKDLPIADEKFNKFYYTLSDKQKMLFLKLWN